MNFKNEFYKILAIVLILLLMPCQAFAMGRTGTSSNKISERNDEVAHGASDALNEAFKSVSFSYKRQGTASTVVSSASDYKSSGTYNSYLNFGVHKEKTPFKKVGGSFYTQVFCDGKEVSKGSGKTFKFSSITPGNYTIRVTGSITYRIDHPSEKGKAACSTNTTIKHSAQKSFTVGKPALVAPSLSIVVPAGMVVGKSYTITGIAKLAPGATIKTQKLQITNSSSCKQKQTGNKLAITPATPSNCYQVKYTVTDSNGQTATVYKTFAVTENGPVITLNVDTPLAINQKGNVSFRVDPKGKILSYKWTKSYIPYGTSNTIAGFPNAAAFNAITAPGTTTFSSSAPGEYILSVIATDKATGKAYPSTYKHIQVVSGLQAAIQVKSRVTQGDKCSAKSISIVPAPSKIVKEFWTVTDSNGKSVKKVIEGSGTTVSINTSILGTHNVELYVMDNTGAISNKVNKTVKVVAPGEIIVEEPTKPAEIFPTNTEDLIPFEDITIPDSKSTKVKCALPQRGQNGPCAGSGKSPHVYNDAGLKALELAHEKDGIFQYWRISVQLSGYDDNNKPFLKTYKNYDNLPVLSNDSSKFTITFDKEGTYQVYGSKWWYFEWQHMEHHKHKISSNPNKYKYCDFLQYDGGADIEKEGEVGPYKVVITPDQVGKPIDFDGNWKQEKVKTESYLVE
ncbi:hypothetical protein [Aminipila sp.]|uniref:hypothetical protein n=1 Tax=Aminipila sp. TaxID=2060095 RepID=UPI002899CA26|nr:hypothetical protein [Aminipila sp.]